MRCFEIENVRTRQDGVPELNNNMRCFEIEHSLFLADSQ